MVALQTVIDTNASVTTPQLVAVFGGGTSGIGSYTALKFAEHTVQPKIYFIGRSEEAADELAKQMRSKNPKGTYTFLKADLSSIKDVDKVCEAIKKAESSLNVLFMSQGAFKYGDSIDGLPYIEAIAFYSRMRMAQNLLPLLRKGQNLRRLVTVLAGGKEENLHLDDIGGRSIPFKDFRGHSASITTLTLEGLAREAPEVSFVHDYPGQVPSNLIRKESALVLRILKYAMKVWFLNSWIPPEESGERHLFLCVSGRYPPKAGDSASDFAQPGDLGVALGTDGNPGSGVYVVDESGESCMQSKRYLDGFRDGGAVDKLLGHIDREFKRVTASHNVI